jgi:hypothetical protein
LKAGHSKKAKKRFDIFNNITTFTPMITTIDRATCKLLRDEMNAALQAVATKHGIQITAKNGTFSPTAFTLKFEAAVIGSSGVAETKEREAFKQLAELYSLKADWLDKSFNHGSDSYTIIGLNSRKHKRPVLCQQKANGKVYLFEARLVQMLMAAQAVNVTPAPSAAQTA